MDIAERNKEVKLRKKRRRFGDTQKKILLLLLGGIALSCAKTPNRQWKIIKGISSDWQDIKRQAAERAVAALYESKLLEAKQNEDGTITLLLSDEGRLRASTYRMSHIKVSHTDAWNKKWWIVLYDIPEDERAARNALATTSHD